VNTFKQFLAETVDKKLFFKGSESKKTVLYKYDLLAKAGYVKLGAKFKSEQFRIEARTKKGELVGWVNFEEKNDKLEALDLHVDPKHRRKGLATEMYKFAKELGNDINPSDKQTALGKLFWADKK
jgi:ribosomal protein S18 acetylase RimI-like enzyme